MNSWHFEDNNDNSNRSEYAFFIVVFILICIVRGNCKSLKIFE